MTEFDISSFDGTADKFEEGFNLDIKHPVTGESTGLVIRIASYRSERVRRIQRKKSNEAIRENKKNPKKAGTVEKVEEIAFEIQAAAVLSWNLTDKGQKVDATFENVLKYLTNPNYFFIAEQIDKAADDEANFMTPSPKN